jgi:hypothetical protein
VTWYFRIRESNPGLPGASKSIELDFQSSVLKAGSANDVRKFPRSHFFILMDVQGEAYMLTPTLMRNWIRRDSLISRVGFMEKVVGLKRLEPCSIFFDFFWSCLL